MEFAEGADLFEFRKKIATASRTRNLPLAMVKKIARGVLGALRRMHRNGVVHRDVKGENIMVDSNSNIKVGLHIIPCTRFLSFPISDG